MNVSDNEMIGQPTYNNTCFSQDIRSEDEPFGGACVVFAGDFRQVLPVKKHGSRAQTVATTVHRSHIWHQVRVRILLLIGCSLCSIHQWTN